MSRSNGERRRIYLRAGVGDGGEKPGVGIAKRGKMAYLLRLMFWKTCMRTMVGAALAAGLVWAPPVQAQVKTLKAVSHAGKRYVALRDLAAMYGLPLSQPGGKTLLIRGQYVSLQFTMDGREALVNGSKVWLHAPVINIRGSWSISDADSQFVVDPLVRPSAYLGARGARTVVLDAGHGGKDPGAVGRSGIQEKDLALDIALRTAAHLRANGLKVAMTRDRDHFWTLQDRPFLAARGGGDLFVSIHLNATASRSVQGVETFATAAEHYPPTAESRLTGKYPAVPNNRFNHSNGILAHQIQRMLVGITRADDRGVKRARFHVLRESAMPSALVECGFLSNPQEEQKLATPAYREAVAQGIAQGILNYLALVNRAKVELGAPVAQAPVQPAVAPLPAPIPMAARAWGQPAVPAVVAQAPVAPGVPAVVAQAPVVAASPPPVYAPAATIVENAPAAVPQVVAAPRPVAPPPLQAIAPPPSSLLNPNLGRN